METSIWKGSVTTASIIAHQISDRWGSEEAGNYDPQVNCFTLKGWQQRRYHVRKGEKALVSHTFLSRTIKVKDSHSVSKDNQGEETDKVITSRIPKNVYLFYIKQVDKNKGK